MLVSYNWLSDFCKLPDVDQLASDFNRIGFEVESMIKKGQDLSNILIGQINVLDSHPDADRLRVAQVNIGSKIIQIVTAATNVNVGDKIPVSLPGATLAGGLKIKKGKLRGVESNGMMCSAVECGLTDSASGVWVLPSDVPVGEDFVQYAGLVDYILDISILPNRGDCLSLFGLARECSALYQVPIVYDCKESEQLSKAFEIDSNSVNCSIDEQCCDYYQAQRISNIHQKETSVVWQVRLYYSGFRPILWLVDITNIVMLETGQPMHAFDASHIKDISVEFSKKQAVTLLNEKTITIDSNIPVVNINDQVGAVAGIMGAEGTEVTSDTSEIILEMAIFNPVVVRKASSFIAVRSESSHRFERCVDISSLMLAMGRVFNLLSMHDQIVIYEPVKCGNNAPTSLTIDLCLDKVNRLIGTKYSESDVKKALLPLGFIVNDSMVTIPSWRKSDCLEWPDIAEELCRFTGIDQTPSIPISAMVSVQHNDQYEFNLKAQTMAVQLGLTQVLPFPLLESDKDGQPKIKNPISPSMTTLRSNGIETLLNVAALNTARHDKFIRIFSIAPIWETDGTEQDYFSVLIQGDTQYQPYRPSNNQPIDFYKLKGFVEQFIGSLGHRFDVKSSRNLWFHPGQSAEIIINDNVIGVFGMCHPQKQLEYKFGPTGLIDINLARLNKMKVKHVQYCSVSKYPSTTRDVTYIMDKRVNVQEILVTLQDQKPALCDSINLCGYYEQPSSDDVNVSFRMVYQDYNSSLDMDTVNVIHKEFAETVIKKLPCRFP